MIRPEAAATLNRLREALAGALLVGIGGWLVLKPGYVLPLVGAGLAALGAGLAVVGLRRMWFRADGQGPGVVQVIEGQVAYFGPVDASAQGGFVALDDLMSLALTADGAHWRLTSVEGTVLVIPRAARGAENLLDAFVRLPGLDPAALVRAASAGPGPADRRLWHRGPRLVQLPPGR
jgi:hypothetical protein